MSSIFISHSQKDQELVDFFKDIFDKSMVKPIFEEIEAIEKGNITGNKINYDIKNSLAVFVLLGKNASTLPHTRDWIVWESGASTDKDVWVFVPENLQSEISIVIPKLTYLVIFRLTESWKNRIRQLLSCYNLFLSAALPFATGAIGAAIGKSINKKEPKTGAIVGGMIGGTVGAITKKIIDETKKGINNFQCKYCKSKYIVQTDLKEIRCPVCNVQVKLSVLHQIIKR